MLRNHRLRLVLLIILLALGLTTSVWGAPGPFGKLTGAVTDAVTTSILKNPDLTVEKTLTGQSTTPIASGTVLTYTIRATNTGNVTLSNVEVSDTLVTPNTVTCSSVGLGVTCDLVGTHTATPADVDAGQIVNTGSAVSDEITEAATATITTTIQQHAVLTIDKTLTGQSATPIALGTVLTYRVTVVNTGNVTVHNVVVSDSLLTRTGGSTPCATLALGATCVLEGTHTVTQADVDAGQIVNMGSAASDEITEAVTDTVTTTIQQHATLAVDKALTGQSTTPIALGTVLTYSITVTNAGNVTVHNVVVSDPMLTPASEDCSTVAVGAICVLTGSYVVQESDFWAGEIVNTATATADDPNGDPLDPETDAVTISLVVVLPVANPDESLGNPISQVVTVDVLANDIPGDLAIDPTSVVIVNPPAGSTLSLDGKLLLVPDEGYWTVSATTGAITFTPDGDLTGNPTPITYTVEDDQGNTSNPATVTITYTENPLARNDASLGNPVGSAVIVDVLTNDTAAAGRTLDPASVQIAGTANPGASLVVAGQGTWSVNVTTGAITFTPEAGYVGNPTPIAYMMTDDQGNASNAATVMITYTIKFDIFLPLVNNHWPPIPAAPVLNTINNTAGDNDYLVSWNSTEYATSYVLQEATTSSFADVVQVYSDTGTTVFLSDRGPTRYYYRVRARNLYANSAWSNVRSVDVLWEKEPNDDALAQANGPLISEFTYYGYFPNGADSKDYFFINLLSAQSVELWLSNIAAGQDYDIILRDAALQVVGYSGELGNTNEHIRTAVLPAGRYYIQVYNRSSSGSTQPYHLRVVYPAGVRTSFEEGRSYGVETFVQKAVERALDSLLALNGSEL